MNARYLTVCALVIALAASSAYAEKVRFDTNVGNIDIVLNPQGLSQLQGHVNNMLAYIDAGRYDMNLINRADFGTTAGDPTDDFVLQFGGFSTDTQTLPDAFADFSAVEAFDNVVVDSNGDGEVDFNTENLQNVRGTVSLALSGTDVNSGTSSFFVNVTDNESLDLSGFVPFAVVQDMSTVDLIMRLSQGSLPDGSLASSNIPLINSTNNLLVFVERAYVLDRTQSTPPPAASASTGGGAGDTFPGSAEMVVPEPTGLVLALAGLSFAALRRRR